MIHLSPRYGHYIRILHSSTDQAMTSALASMDLTAAQGHILGFLTTRTDAPCSRDIAEVFHMSHPTISGLLSRLEKKGFIECRPDEKDRRCKRVYILEKGRQCHAMMHNTILAAEDRMLRDFTPEEKEQFARLLLRAIDNMGVNCNHKRKEEKSE